MPHAPADPGAFPPDEQLAVVTLATRQTEEHDQPATRWSLDDLAMAIVNEAHHRAMSRATIWRILDQADLKPHQGVYWLNARIGQKSTGTVDNHIQGGDYLRTFANV